MPRFLLIVGLIFASTNNLAAQSKESRFIGVILNYSSGSLKNAQIPISDFYSGTFLDRFEPQDTSQLVSVVADDQTYYVRYVPKEQGYLKPFLLQIVVEGEMALYVTPKASGIERYFVERDKYIAELRSYTKKLANGDVLEVKEYRSILTHLTRDCDGFADRFVNSTNLSLSALVRTITRYNLQCGSGSKLLTINKRSSKPIFHLGIVAGTSVVRSSIRHPNVSPRMLSHNSHIKPFAGLSLAINPHALSRTTFVNELTVNYGTGSLDASVGLRNGLRRSSSIDVKYVEIQNQITASVALMKTQGFQANLGVGGAISRAITSSATQLTYYTRRGHDEKAGQQKATVAFNTKTYIYPAASLTLGFQKFALRYTLLSNDYLTGSVERRRKEHRIGLTFRFAKF